MKKFLLAVFAASALMMVACGDDGSSDAGNVVMTQRAALSVDEAQQMLVVTEPESYQDKCVREPDSSIIWKNVKLNDERLVKMKYEFLGDTLVLYGFEDGELDNYGEMYLGGTPGKLYGTWNGISCEHSRGEGVTECYEKEARYVKYTINFSEREISANYEYNYDLYLEDIEAKGYMNSDFMLDLYQLIQFGYGYGEIYADQIYDFDEYEDGNLQTGIEEFGIEIVESSEKSQTFKQNGKTLTVSLDKIDMNLDEYADEEVEISISLTDGSTTCNLDYEKRNPTKAMCKAENVDNLRFEEDYDDDGNEYEWAYRYRATNTDEFVHCVCQMLGYEDHVVAPFLYKKAVEKDSARKDRLQKHLKKMQKLVEN